jgi:hypothetical protein
MRPQRFACPQHWSEPCAYGLTESYLYSNLFPSLNIDGYDVGSACWHKYMFERVSGLHLMYICVTGTSSSLVIRILE